MSTALSDDEKDDLAALRELVVECPDLRELERLLGQFNLFEVLRLTNNEIRHSNVLAWLLDPEETHGLRDLFLRRWLMRVFHENESDAAPALDPVDIDSAPFSEVRIFREWAHLDLLIEIQVSGETWAVAIENKVWSSQHSDQLATYRKRVKDAYPKARLAFILLSVVAEEPEDDPYVVATYAQVKRELDRCLDEQRGVLGDEPRLVIDHYRRTIETHFMPGSPVEELARKIYQAHRRALDVIFSHRPDTISALTEQLAELLKEEVPKSALKMVGYTKGQIWLIPDSWEVPENRIKGDEHAVWCEINFYDMGRLVFKAVAGPAEKLWREKLFEISKAENFKNTQNKKVLTETYFQFYGVANKSLNLPELDPDDVEQGATRIWDWCVDQIKHADYQKVVAVVADHLKSHKAPDSKIARELEQPQGAAKES